MVDGALLLPGALLLLVVHVLILHSQATGHIEWLPQPTFALSTAAATLSAFEFALLTGRMLRRSLPDEARPHDATLIFNIGWLALAAALVGDAVVVVAGSDGSLIGYVCVAVLLTLMAIARR
jgi:hypothetical protein